ncbi:hypothetical protein [Alloalcanivorax xenomutans]|uniref:hypothetical protein n=1 Tax=Alloalcanivorax xenomutans TaxID=1094342 RepID=UPI0024E1D79A|nr:hypothetical protein [Alloalcanivorax xenomutans]
MKRQRGALTVVTPLIIILIVLFSALALDGARLLSMQKEMQAQANAAAFAAAGSAYTCGGTDSNAMRALAIDAATAQGFDSGSGSIRVQQGVIKADSEKVLEFRRTDSFEETNGVAIEIERDVPISSLLPEAVLGRINLVSRAAARKEVYATFFTDSNTLALNTADSPVLSALFRGLFGKDVNVETLSLDSLSGTLVSLDSLLGAINDESNGILNPVLEDLGVGDLLEIDVPAEILISALGAVSNLTGDAVSELDSAIALLGVDTNLRLSDVIYVLGQGAVDSGAEIPVLSMLNSIVLNLANKLDKPISLDLDGLTSSLGLGDVLGLNVEIDVNQAPKIVVAPARKVDGQWLGESTGEDITIRLGLILDLAPNTEFLNFVAIVPLEISTGAAKSTLVGARCASGSNNNVDFDFDIGRSVLRVATYEYAGDNSCYGSSLSRSGICAKIGLLFPSSGIGEDYMPDPLQIGCHVRNPCLSNYNWDPGPSCSRPRLFQSPVSGNRGGWCRYDQDADFELNLVNTIINVGNIEPEATLPKPLLITKVPLSDDEAPADLPAECEYEESARQVTCTLGLQSGQVLADSLNSLLGTIDIEELDLLGIPLADPLAFIVDALSGIVDIVVGPILEYVLGPLLDFLGVSLGQAKLNLLKSEQSTVQLLQYCGPEGC